MKRVLTIAPSAVSLTLWMVVPLLMTLWFSFQRYQLLAPQNSGFNGGRNYAYLLTDPALWTALINTVLLLGTVLVITVVFGLALALLFSQDFAGQSMARLLVIAPFFVMPTVSALIWKNMLMHPVNGLFAYLGGARWITPHRLVWGLAHDIHYHYCVVAMGTFCITGIPDRSGVG